MTRADGWLKGSIVLVQTFRVVNVVAVLLLVSALVATLRAMLRTVQDDEPFAPANAVRLRTIGWMLLVVQLADLALGGVTFVAHTLRIDFLPWQPGFTGWIAVLVAFVLAQVFERGAARQGDLDGTV